LPKIFKDDLEKNETNDENTLVTHKDFKAYAQALNASIKEFVKKSLPCCKSINDKKTNESQDKPTKSLRSYKSLNSFYLNAKNSKRQAF